MFRKVYINFKKIFGNIRKRSISFGKILRNFHINYRKYLSKFIIDRFILKLIFGDMRGNFKRKLSKLVIKFPKF